MFKSIKTSAANKEVVTILTNKLALGPENTIARIALSYSLSRGKKFELKEISDSKGKEYRTSVLFGNNLTFYIALICQHYNIYKTNKNIAKYIKMHIDEGLQLINKEIKSNPNLSGVDLLIDEIDKGLLALD